ncbi:MAG: class I SAM-dependent methyltransferase [Candidatus Micrarchaeia archaeon]
MTQRQIMQVYRNHLKRAQEDYPLIPYVPAVPETATGKWTRYHAREPGDFHRIIAALRTVYGHLPEEKKGRVRILVLAGGYGQLSHILSKEGYDPYTVDLDTEKTLETGKGEGLQGEMISADAFRLPFRNRRFDAVVSDHFLKSDFFKGKYLSEYPFKNAPHVSGNPSRMENNAFSEVRRVSKDNAVVVISKSVVKRGRNEILRDDYSKDARSHERFHVQTFGSPEKMKRIILSKNPQAIRNLARVQGNAETRR